MEEAESDLCGEGGRGGRGPVAVGGGGRWRDAAMHRQSAAGYGGGGGGGTYPSGMGAGGRGLGVARGGEGALGGMAGGWQRVEQRNEE